MSQNWAFLFPGQGAQVPGMGKAFFDAYQESRMTFEEADDLLGQNLTRIIFEGPKDVLTETKNSQLAIFVMSMALLRALRQHFPTIQPSMTAGLSLGEYTAVVAAGMLDFKEALFLVRDRAEFMQQACIEKPGGMVAVLGMDENSLTDALNELQMPHDVWAANFNCPGQIVIAGTKLGMEKAAVFLKEKGAKRTIPLEVHGAFHSGLMQPARAKLASSLSRVHFKKGICPVVTNVLGDGVNDPSLMPKLLEEQVTSPVRWERSVRTMMAQGIVNYLEIGPGKTLAGFNRKIGVLGKTFNLEVPEDFKEIEIFA